MKAPHQQEPEQLFWTWVQECTKPRGWIRYSPEIARALGSDRNALVLSYAVHLDGRGSGPYSAGRWFYKSIAQWSKELAVPPAAVERALESLCIDWRPRDIQYSPFPDAKGHVRHPRTRTVSLGLLHRWFASKHTEAASGIYHYRVDWPRLATWWKLQSEGYGQLPLALEFHDTATQLGKKFLTGMSQSAQLDSPSTLNQFGLWPQTSGEDHAEDGQAPDEHSGTGAGSAPQTPALSFGQWKETDSAHAIQRLFTNEGWEEATVRDAMYRAFERGGKLVDVYESRYRCEEYYKSQPKVTQWPGFFAKWFLQGE